MRTASVAKKTPMPARTYSFIEPARGIIVASSEKLIDWRYMATSPIASAMSQLYENANPDGDRVEHGRGDDQAEGRADRRGQADRPPLEAYRPAPVSARVAMKPPSLVVTPDCGARILKDQAAGDKLRRG